MDEVLVRLKPLKILQTQESVVKIGNEDTLVIARSWISKPSVMDDSEEDLLFGSNNNPDFFGSRDWNCPGCPPPYFDLPPPPRPDFLPDPDYCADGIRPDRTGSTGFASPYETCDNPIIVDSDLMRQNDLLNIFLIVISAFVAVLVILLTACIIWRKRVSLIHSLPIRKYQASDERLSNETQANSDFRNFSPMQKCDISSSGFPKTAHNFNAPIELAEHPTPSGKPRHVYSNPNYPAMEIGGLPFFLMPSSSDRDTVLTTSNLHRDGFNDHDYVSTASQRSGPIYEDIDRMCTYRGAPPDLGVDKHSVSPKMSGDRTYYNVPASSKFGNRPDSSGASSSSPHQQCGTGTSSSEVSFESGSSPRHPVQRQNVASSPLHQGHVIVNPVNSRNRTFSPNSSYSARMTQQSRASPSSSVYYYSDTLRPRQNRALAVDSDSGISNVQDTPPPPPPGTTLPPLPSQRFVTKDIKDPKISSSKNRSESSIVSPQSLGFSGESKKTRRKGSSAVKV